MSPIPNQRISQGASAYFGMPMVNMMAGSTASVARGERRSRNGRITPAMPAMAKPATATRSVARMSENICPLSGERPQALRGFERRREEQRPERARAVFPAGDEREREHDAPAIDHPFAGDGGARGNIGHRGGDVGHCTSALIFS